MNTEIYSVGTINIKGSATSNSAEETVVEVLRRYLTADICRNYQRIRDRGRAFA
jgi:hypothetical protein